MVRHCCKKGKRIRSRSPAKRRRGMRSLNLLIMHTGVPLPLNPMEELEQNKKLAEQKLSSKELYELKKGQKEHRKEVLAEAPKKFGKYLLYSLIGVALIGGIGWFITT